MRVCVLFSAAAISKLCPGCTGGRMGARGAREGASGCEWPRGSPGSWSQARRAGPCFGTPSAESGMPIGVDETGGLPLACWFGGTGAKFAWPAHHHRQSQSKRERRRAAAAVATDAGLGGASRKPEDSVADKCWALLVVLLLASEARQETQRLPSLAKCWSSVTLSAGFGVRGPRERRDREATMATVDASGSQRAEPSKTGFATGTGGQTEAAIRQPLADQRS